jgi:choline dehydrogenase-like flavoprotein
MADFGPNVGIQFQEAASGPLAGGISDPEAAARVAESTGQSFRLDLQISIPRLQAFLASPDHAAEIVAGRIDWQPGLTAASVLPGGRVTMFRSLDSTRKHKSVDFAFSFPAPEGGAIDCLGAKDLHQDNGLDAATDLSTIHLSLQRNGAPLATGIVQSDILEFVRQIQSCRVTGAVSPGEERAAREAFFGFVNAQLREVYDNLPLIFKDATQLSPEQRKTLQLCMRLLMPSRLPAAGPTFDDITAGLDRFLANASSTQLGVISDWLQAIGAFLPSGATDLTLLRILVNLELNRTDRSPVREVLQLLHTLVVFPYYAHPKADRLVGYQRPVHVPRNTPDLPVVQEPPDRLYDYAIAGSGPAGTLLAQRLSAKGKSVLLLEAGPYVPERIIDADEVLWTAKLYKDSALQQANTGSPLFGMQGPSFMVLQGACVGGGGIINNAVCFRLQNERLAQWQAIGFPISAAGLAAAYDRVALDLGIKPASEAALPSPRLNPTWKFLTDQWGQPRKPPVGDPPEPGLYECLVNIEGCLGTGLCNVGCGSERKNNGVQVYLRQAVAAGCVIAECAQVQRVRVAAAAGSGRRRVESLEVRLRGGRTVLVRAKQFILSSGPVGSSVVLLRSGDLDQHFAQNAIPVGRRFSANLGSPVFAFCKDPVNQQPGLQIAHYYAAPPGDGFVVETWFNPPGANAMAMPGFGQAHFDRMMAYARTVAAAPLVRSEASGRVKIDWRGQTAVELPISGQEIGRLRRGLVLLCGAFLAGKVEHAVVGLGNGRKLQTPADLAQLDRDLQDIERNPSKAFRLRIGTGHPQGGNAMSADPHIAVVDEQFRLRGFDNLRICDGSVFPDSAGVNPQWTIMALAHECAGMLEG